MLQNAARGTARHIAIAKGDYIARNARVPHIVPKAYRAPQGHIPAVPNARSAIHDRRSIHACLHAIHDGEAVNSFVLFVPTFVVGDGVLDVPSRCSRVVPRVRMRETPFTTALPSNHSFPSRRAPEASPTGEVSRLVVTEGAHKTNLASRESASLLAPTGASHHLPRRGGYGKRRRG